mmetsp:Transcript_36412/g.67284  ORF Transcript_36412/g.67284 Transcript_36412/m.67284 type:complete len:83 (+) Transcript_36412:934-1182(+)
MFSPSSPANERRLMIIYLHAIYISPHNFSNHASARTAAHESWNAARLRSAAAERRGELQPALRAGGGSVASLACACLSVNSS